MLGNASSSLPFVDPIALGHFTSEQNCPESIEFRLIECLLPLNLLLFSNFF